MRAQKNTKNSGFTLLEMMIALSILTIGVLGLAAMLATSLSYMQNSEYDLMAQQKAQEAMEAIFTAKYDDTVTWDKVANPSATHPNGIFLVAAQPILQPGADGLVGTSADSSAPAAYIYYPGPDGLMGTADDIQVPLTGFTRTIQISDVVGNPNLRTIVVSVNYAIGRANRTYTMNSSISAFN